MVHPVNTTFHTIHHITIHPIILLAGTSVATVGNTSCSCAEGVYSCAVQSLPSQTSTAGGPLYACHLDVRLKPRARNDART